MEPIITQLPGSKVEIKFCVSPEEAKPFIDKVVEEISMDRPIQGFRPGKAPYAEVSKLVGGDMKVWQYALEAVVRSQYVRTVLQNNLETVGSPEVAVDQLTPGQEMKFTCTVSLMPTVRKAMEVEKPFVEVKHKDVKESDVDTAVEDLQKMRREEVMVDETTTKDHMIEIDLEIKKDGVIVEGGTARNYRVYLNEDHYIPKFSEQLIGLKKGEKKTFVLPFPEDHYQKLFAGKDMEFTADVKQVYALRLPAVDDAFAESLGVDGGLQALRDLLKKNMKTENDRHSMEVAEIELLETLVKKSDFTEIPELLVKEEVRRMFEELKSDVEHRQGRMEDYLSSIKKTADQLKLVPRAMDRIKTSVLVRHVAKAECLDVSPETLDAEIDRLISIAPDKETRERVSSPDYREYVATMLRNRKTLEVLKTKGIKDYETVSAELAKQEAEHHHDEEGHTHGPDCHHD